MFFAVTYGLSAFPFASPARRLLLLQLPTTIGISHSSMLLQLLAAIPLLAHAAPFFDQVPLGLNTGGDHGLGDASTREEHDFNVRHHLSGISPFFDSHGPQPDAPDGCLVISSAILSRHSSIYMNDDEWPETLEPFVKKLTKFDKSKIPDDSPLAFLKEWQSPVNDDNMEQLTEPGARDATALGVTLGNRYKDLLPTSEDPPFKLFSASSSRDIDTSHAFIKGMFPGREIGNQTGQVQLISVPNKAEKWSNSLTPHKSCARYDKSVGKKQRDHFQKVYTKPIIKRFSQYLPGWKLKFTDIVAMQQWCGYEIAIHDSSSFCDLFTPDEFLAFEYSQDLYYYYQLGKDNKWTGALGIPWLQIAVAKLNQTVSRPIDAIPVPTPTTANVMQTTTSPLPQPTRGPNATLSQPVHVWFTHREEIPLVTHALDLFHGHNTASRVMPIKKINPDRAFKTSEILPFLGHVALERMECAKRESVVDEGKQKPTDPYVRILVNGSPQEHRQCHSGPGGSCPLHEFAHIIRGLPNIYGELESVCNSDKK